MRVNFNKEDNTKLFYRLVLVFVSILFFFMVYRFDGFKKGISTINSVLAPVIFGGVLAFLINIPLSFLEKKFKKLNFYNKLSFKKQRAISLILTYILVILFIFVFFSVIIPQLISSVTKLTSMVSDYLNNNKFESWEQVFNKYGVLSEISEFLTDRIAKLTEYFNDLLSKIGPMLTSLASGVVSTTIMVFIGFFISIYLLNSKEHFAIITKKTTYAILPKKVAAKLIEIIRDLGDSIKSYLTGTLLASIILGLEVSLVLFFLGVEGIITIFLVVTISNMIPYVGPWIGGLPLFIIIAVQDVQNAFIFVAIMLIGQQIDANIVQPRIQSGQMGINSFWIVVVIIISGSLFGIFGMIIGVPIFSVIYSLIKEFVEYLLERKGLPKASNAYKAENEIKLKENNQLK